LSYHVVLTPKAREMLLEIQDRCARQLVSVRINTLAEEPEKNGSPLLGDLRGFFSIRAVGQRYRIVYRIDQESAVVQVVAVGIRREGDRDDIYNLVRRLVILGLIGPPN